MIIIGGSTKKVHFMTHGGGGGSFAGAWPYKSYSEDAFFLNCPNVTSF